MTNGIRYQQKEARKFSPRLPPSPHSIPTCGGPDHVCGVSSPLTDCVPLLSASDATARYPDFLLSSCVGGASTAVPRGQGETSRDRIFSEQTTRCSLACVPSCWLEQSVMQTPVPLVLRVQSKQASKQPATNSSSDPVEDAAAFLWCSATREGPSGPAVADTLL